MRRLAIVLFISLLGTIGWTGTSAAADDVVVQVTSIVASMSQGEGEAADEEAVVDPKLSGYAEKLRSLFAYERYSFVGSSRAGVAFGGVCSFQLPERFALEVEPERFEPEARGRIEMLVTLFQEAPSRRGDGAPRREVPEREIVLRTRIRLKSGGTVLLGGPSVEDGVLILALSARR